MQDKNSRSSKIKICFQIFTLIIVPILGAVYFSARLVGSYDSEIVPFKTYQAPKTIAVLNGEQSNKYPIVFTKKITVVNFWASWCAPCVEEFPAMMQLQSILQDYDIEFIFISIDENWQDVVKFQTQFGIELLAKNNLWDPNKKISASWNSEKFPESYVVRNDGWVLEKIIGFQRWTRPAVIEYFKKLAGKDTAGL